MENLNLEEAEMNIIADAGGARSCVFAAIGRARKSDFAGAAEEMRRAGEYLAKAHNVHSALLAMEAGGALTAGSMLLSHTQDHLMAAELAKDLGGEILDVYRALFEAKGGSA